MIVSYIRTSTDRPQNSIDTQIATIETYCEYKGIRSQKYYVDLGSPEKHVIVPNSMIF